MPSLKVSDYMNRQPVVFTKTMAIEEAVHRLLVAGQGGGPVVDEHKKVIGFLSEQDCIKQMLEGTYHQVQSATVADCMSPHELATVMEDKAVLDLAQELSLNRPKIYPVINYHGALVGIISRTDVLRAIDLHLKGSYDT